MIAPLVIQRHAGEQAHGGGLEGAERTTRETFRWTPSPLSIDAQMARSKPMADLRARDSVQNDGYAMGAMTIHKDSIVGAHYRLNSRPNARVLRTLGFTADEVWAEEFQQEAENLFGIIAESPNAWLDAAGIKTFTEMVRLVVGSWVLSGENLGTSEWFTGQMRPLRTAINLIPPDRLSNPDGLTDTRYLRQGVELDKFGRPLAYHIRVAAPGDIYIDALGASRWMRVPREKPWGRRQVLHGYAPLQPHQTRGISEMVAVLKQMRMTRKYQDMVLQNAVIQASYAAAIESEIPREMIAEMMGAGGNPDGMATSYLGELLEYVRGGRNINIDGAAVPILYPGTKLNISPLAAPGGMGDKFEQSLLRHTAAGLGLSYEQFARDYSQTNYSSARASAAETEKYMASRKKAAADAFATQVWYLVLEEMVSMGNLPMPGGLQRRDFYRPLVKEALGKCTWIGAGRGHIDRLKETQAAVLAINSGLSTHEAEIALMGGDYRDTFEQIARERKLQEQYHLTFDLSATRPGSNAAQQTMTSRGEDDAA